MAQTEYEKAVAEFLSKKGVTRCPTACATPTRTTIAEQDRAALRNYGAAREAARQEKRRQFQQIIAA